MLGLTWRRSVRSLASPAPRSAAARALRLRPRPAGSLSPRSRRQQRAHVDHLANQHEVGDVGDAVGIGSGDRELVAAKHLQQSRPPGITGEQPEQAWPCAEAERGAVGLRNEGALAAYVQDGGLARVDIPKQ